VAPPRASAESWSDARNRFLCPLGLRDTRPRHSATGGADAGTPRKFVLSVAAQVVTNQLLALLGREAPSALGMPIIAILFGIVASVLSRRSLGANWGGALGILAGIAIGIGLDIALGVALGRPARNLWPIEIFFVWGIVAIPVLLGVNVGRYSDH
jgi:hypothetical protein